MGIKDYELKFKAIETVLEVDGRRDVFTKIDKAANRMDPKRNKLFFDPERAYQAAHKWKSGTKPGTQHRHFFTVLFAEIGSNFDQNRFVNCTYAEFVQSLY